MKRFISILLLSSVLLTQTELYQLLKLPVLILHYAEHKQEDHDLSFIGYVAMHYFNDHKLNDAHGHDKHLPFKSTDEGVMATIAVELPRNYDILFHRFPLNEVALAPRYNEGVPQLHTNDIWQPPRSC